MRFVYDYRQLYVYDVAAGVSTEGNPYLDALRPAACTTGRGIAPSPRPPIPTDMRLRDILLICVLLAAVGVGVYELGRHVDSASSQLGSHDSELNQPVYRPTHKSGPSRRTIELAAGAVGGTAGVIVLFSLASALSRPSRRKATWHAGN